MMSRPIGPTGIPGPPGNPGLTGPPSTYHVPLSYYIPLIYRTINPIDVLQEILANPTDAEMLEGIITNRIKTIGFYRRGWIADTNPDLRSNQQIIDDRRREIIIAIYNRIDIKHEKRIYSNQGNVYYKHESNLYNTVYIHSSSGSPEIILKYTRRISENEYSMDASFRDGVKLHIECGPGARKLEVYYYYHLFDINRLMMINSIRADRWNVGHYYSRLNKSQRETIYHLTISNRYSENGIYFPNELLNEIIKMMIFQEESVKQLGEY